MILGHLGSLSSVSTFLIKSYILIIAVQYHFVAAIDPRELSKRVNDPFAEILPSHVLGHHNVFDMPGLYTDLEKQTYKSSISNEFLLNYK